MRIRLLQKAIASSTQQLPGKLCVKTGLKRSFITVIWGYNLLWSFWKFTKAIIINWDHRYSWWWTHSNFRKWETEKDANSVIHIVRLNSNRCLPIGLVNRSTGRKKKTTKKSEKKSLFFILVVNQHFLMATAEQKYVWDTRLEGPDGENVMKQNCKYTEVYVILLEVSRFNEWM